MKLIVAGGRNYNFAPEDYYKLDGLNKACLITEVVSGGASGADQCGERWAKSKRIPIKLFPADWDKHGKAAGPIRNREMAQYADAAALFPGGKGTQNMHDEAIRAGITIFDFRDTHT